jgi:uncharacterized protein (TIRG00374 family)
VVEELTTAKGARYARRVKELLRRRGIWLAKIAVSGGLSVWLGARMMEQGGFGALADRLEQLAPGWIAVAVALHFTAVFFGVVRWRLLLRSAAVELPFSWLLRSFLIGRFVGAFTPSTTGLDGWRLWEAGRASGSMGRSAAAIGVEKLVGLIGMAVVCAALLPFGGSALIGDRALAVSAVLACAAVLALAILARPRVLEAIAERMPSFVRPRAQKIVSAIGTARLDAKKIAKAIALGLASHGALSAVFWATARALGIELDALTLFAAGNAIVIAVLLPVSVGGVGVRESVAVVLLSGVGVTSTDAVLVALLGYLTGQVPALLGGVCFALSRRPHTLAAEQTPA